MKKNCCPRKEDGYRKVRYQWRGEKKQYKIKYEGVSNRCTYVCTKGFDVFATLPNYSSCILKQMQKIKTEIIPTYKAFMISSTYQGKKLQSITSLHNHKSVKGWK